MTATVIGCADGAGDDSDPVADWRRSFMNKQAANRASSELLTLLLLLRSSFPLATSNT